MQEQSGNRDRSGESKTGIPVSVLPEVTKLKEQELAERWRGCSRQREKHSGAGGMKIFKSLKKVYLECRWTRGRDYKSAESWSVLLRIWDLFPTNLFNLDRVSTTLYLTIHLKGREIQVYNKYSLTEHHFLTDKSVPILKVKICHFLLSPLISITFYIFGISSNPHNASNFSSKR